MFPGEIIRGNKLSTSRPFVPSFNFLHKLSPKPTTVGFLLRLLDTDYENCVWRAPFPFILSDHQTAFAPVPLNDLPFFSTCCICSLLAAAMVFFPK